DVQVVAALPAAAGLAPLDHQRVSAAAVLHIATDRAERRNETHAVDVRVFRQRRVRLRPRGRLVGLAVLVAGVVTAIIAAIAATIVIIGNGEGRADGLVRAILQEHL